MNMLAPSELPNSAAARARGVEEMRLVRRPPPARIAFFSRSTGSEKSAERANSPGMISAVLATKIVWFSRTAASTFLAPDTTRSQPRIRSALPAETRIAWISSGVLAIRTWLNTEPPFWARPAMSIMPQPLPSRCAAMPRMAPMVTTPVPPTPSMIDAQPSCRAETAAGSGTPSSGSAVAGDALGLADLGAVHGDEGRAEAVDAGEILVAARLVDPALAAEFGLDRLDRDAVRLHAAIAAALADQFVDDDALVGIRKRAALAAAALFGRAGLVVEQHRDALDLAQLALDEVEVVAMMERRAGGKLRARRTCPARRRRRRCARRPRRAPAARSCRR